MLLPLLFRPKAQSWANRFEQRKQSGFGRSRDIILLFLGGVLFFATYYTVNYATKQSQTDIGSVYFHPSLILGLLTFPLFMMLLFTNTILALGSLFMGRDIELLLSSPIRPRQLLAGKLLEIIVVSSWITIIFVTPIIAAFGSAFNASYTYYITALFYLLLNFLLAGAFSIVLAHSFAALLILLRFRFIRICISAAFLCVFVRSGLSLFLKISDLKDITLDTLISAVNALSVFNVLWLPSFWISTALSELLVPTGKSLLPYTALLLSVTTFSLASAFLCIRFLHFRAYSLVSQNNKAQTLFGKSFSPLSRLLKLMLPQTPAALAYREILTNRRDLSQVIQFFFLLALCLGYLYFLQVERVVYLTVVDSVRIERGLLLVMTNSFLEAFIITSICLRFVFSAISREGRAFWIIHASPITIKQLLQVKFLTWLFPIALFCSLFFASATLILFDSPLYAVSRFVSTLFLVYGLVGMGIGLGAYFADFDWEHPTQLIAGFGTIIYMVAAIILIGINIRICYSATAFIFVHQEALQNFNPIALSVLSLFLIILLLLNTAVGSLSLEFGKRSLERRF